MIQTIFEIISNKKIAKDVFEMVLEGDTSSIAPGQFVNIKLEGLYLRRPISVCDYSDKTLTLVYKVVGKGTLQMSEMSKGEKLDMLFNLDINEYNGYKSVQLVVREIRPAESVALKLKNENERYLEIMNGASFGADEMVIPRREEFVSVYKALKFGDEGCISESRLRALVGNGINRVMLYVALDVLCETGLCNIDRSAGDGLIRYTVNEVTQKVDLESSPLLIKLRNQQK